MLFSKQFLLKKETKIYYIFFILMENKTLKQWHSTTLVAENWINVFTKHYEPYSYEIKNEVNWLTSNMLKQRSSFSVPDIIDASVEKWYVKMQWIQSLDNLNNEKIFEYILSSAIELHSLIESNQPYLRTHINSEEYIPYLIDYTKYRINVLLWEFDLDEDIIKWVKKNVENLSYWKFGIVHRDLRLRHFLFSEDNNKPFLIDWEFSNISETAQDLAKLIFDWVVNHNQNFRTFFDYILINYSQERRIPIELLRNRILTFLPIIPLEHISSFILRKPNWYSEEVKKDILFINEVYEKEK